MDAIVLAGGFGTRLRSVVPDLPKPMAPIAGKPFLEILLRSLARKGITRVVLSLGYKAETISSHFGQAFAGLEIAYVVEDTPLGTGGATRLAMTQCQSDHVFVFNGDTFLDLEVDAVESLWKASKNPIIVARHVDDTARYGRLRTLDGRVTGFSEKGMSGPGLINAGCYILPRNSLDAWPVNQTFSLEADYFVQTVQAQRVCVHQTNGLFIDIGVPEDFNRAQTVLASYA